MGTKGFLYLVLVIILAAVLIVPASAKAELKPTQAVAVVNTHQMQVSTTEIETDITRAVEKVGPAVVTINSKGAGQATRFGTIAGSVASGSGLFFSQDGYILTNNHVIEGGATYSVVLANGNEIPAQLIGADRYLGLTWAFVTRRSMLNWPVCINYRSKMVCM